MKTLLLLLLCSISHICQADDFALSSASYLGFPNSLGNKDFFTLAATQFRNTKTEEIGSCRENIKKVTCLVDPSAEGSNPTDRLCLEGGKQYAIYFEQIYDQYPPSFQKMFCSLRRIYIEKSFEGTAYAGTIYDEVGNTNGAIIGIRKSVLDENLNLRVWASWKEQLSFGGATDSFSLSANLPEIHTESQTSGPVEKGHMLRYNHKKLSSDVHLSTPADNFLLERLASATFSAGPSVNDFLYFVITHEFGHIFDFTNKINETKACPPPENKEAEAECEMKENTWGSIGWITNLTPKPSNDFPLRKSLCFYWCKNHTLDSTQVLPVYQAFSNTSFISLYSTTQPWDDFADSLAYFLMHKNLATKYGIDTKQNQYYDISAKLRSRNFAEKYKYLEEFLLRKDILYP